ncbi:CapA family protein [Deinococcus cavernae]|nr:CapA family protein [Deinococcus cavernae]
MASLTCLANGQTLTFVGDINLARRSVEDWASIFTPVRFALRGDLVIGNLESPLTDQSHGRQGIDLRASPSAVAALFPYTHLSVENNHAQDGGDAGQLQSRRILLQHDITPVSTEPTYWKVNGRILALLSYLDGPLGAPIKTVQAAKEQADEVIVLPHWGAEYDAVTPRQREQARALAAAGASLIVGSGPHVLQGSEHIGKTLVLYSLGNFLFDQPYPATWLGGAAHVTWREGTWKACLQPTFSRGGKLRSASRDEARQAAKKTGLLRCTVWK